MMRERERESASDERERERASDERERERARVVRERTSLPLIRGGGGSSVGGGGIRGGERVAAPVDDYVACSRGNGKEVEFEAIRLQHVGGGGQIHPENT